MEDSLNIFGEILVFSSEIHICFILFGLAEQHVDENKQVERLQSIFFFSCVSSSHFPFLTHLFCQLSRSAFPSAVLVRD